MRLFWWRSPAKNQSKAYLKPGRLEDVMSLIQVLALDPHAHRIENALMHELRDKPQSASNWLDIAHDHTEFFRVYKGRDGVNSASLVARHVLPHEGGRKLSPEFVQGLLMAAIQIHSGQLQRSQILKAGVYALLLSILPILSSVVSLIVNLSSWFK